MPVHTDCATNLRDARERKKYLANHKTYITEALAELHSETEGELMDPIGVFTGVGGISIIYLFSFGSGGIFKDYVAKFELEKTERYFDEIRADARLRKLAVPRSVLKLVHKEAPDESTKRPGLILYEAAQNFSSAGRVAEAQQLLQDQLGSNNANCPKALELLAKELQALHKSYPPQFSERDSHGKPLVWNDFFPGLAAKKRALTYSAEFSYAPIEWESDGGASIIFGQTRLPNPLAALDARLRRLTGRLRLSLVHGDLNATNVLLTLDSFRAPEDLIFIDMVHSATHRPSAIDYARFEVDLWGQLLPKATDSDWQETLCRMRLALEDPQADKSRSWTALEYEFLRLIAAWRKSASVALSDLGIHVPDDYLHCLYFCHMKKLSYGPQGPELNGLAEPVRKAKLGIHLMGASMAEHTLRRIERGAFTKEEGQPFLNRPVGGSTSSPMMPSAVATNDPTQVLASPVDSPVIELTDQAFVAFPEQLEHQVEILRANRAGRFANAGWQLSSVRYRQFKRRALELQDLKDLTLEERSELARDVRTISLMEAHHRRLAEGIEILLFDNDLDWECTYLSVISDAAEAIRNFVAIMSPGSIPNTATLKLHWLSPDKEQLHTYRFLVAEGVAEETKVINVTEEFLRGLGCSPGSVFSFDYRAKVTHAVPAILHAILTQMRESPRPPWVELIDMERWYVA